MKKTLGVFSLIVMLLSQVFSPFVYAVSGEEVPVDEVVVEVVEEPEVVEKGSSDGTKDPENPVEEENIIVNQEQMSGDNLSGTNTEILSGGTIQEETTEENLEGKEDTDVIIENNMVVEAIEKGFGGEVEYNSEEVRGTKEHKNVKVEVYAETGAFEETPTLVIEPLESEKETEIKKVILDYNEDTENLAEEEIEQVAEEKITEVVAFDIKFLDKEEKEVQPREGMVKVEFNYTENETLQETEEHEVKVYHLDDKDNAGDPIEEIKSMKIDEPEVTEEINVENEELDEPKVEEGTGEQKLTVVGDKFSIYTIVQQVKEEGPQAITEDQLANFVYGEISIARPDGLIDDGPAGFTIMDRNLGAITTGAYKTVSSISYGYHYQWGNNYGFNLSWTKETNPNNFTGNKISIAEGTTEYSGNKFVGGPSSQYVSWMNDNRPTLWGGNSDSVIDKQGPCPEGWHVPTILEWSQLLVYYAYYFDPSIKLSGAMNKFFSSNTGLAMGFANKFNLPFAGSRDYRDGTVGSTGSNGYYRSSSPTNNNMIYYIGLGPDFVYTTNVGYNFAMGHSVRCFKNSYTPHNEEIVHTITYEYNGGSGSTASINVVSGEKAIEPSEPIKSGYVFDGWYRENTYENKFNFDDNVIIEDIELYAKWSTYTTLISGKEFGAIIKSLSVGSNQAYDAWNSSILGFERSFSFDGVDNYRKISTDGLDMFVWYNSSNGKIYYYTEAVKIYLNEDSSYMFHRLQKIENIDLIYFDTSRVNNMDWMISNCNLVTSIDVSNFDTSNVISMNHMFNYMVGLDNLDITNFDTSNVKDMGYMFAYFSGENLDLSHLNTSKVSNMEGLFYGCSNLKNIDISNFDTISVVNMGFMFYNCSKLLSIKFGVFDTSSVVNMQRMFRGCSSLETLDVSHFDTSNLANVNYMFAECNALESLNMDGWNFSKMPSKSYVFYNIFMSSNNLHYLSASGWILPDDFQYGINYMFNNNLGVLRVIDVSNWDLGLTNDISWLFYNMINLESIIGIDTRKNVNNLSVANAMFYGCSSLNTLKLGALNFGTTTSLNSLFYGTAFTGIDLSEIVIDSVTDFGYMFNNIPNLKTIYVGDNFVSSNMGSSRYIFNSSSSLVGGNGTKYDSTKTDKTYARIDNEYQSGYFTDPNHFAVKFLSSTGVELLKQWIGSGQTVEELEDSHRNYRYYTSGDLQTGFDFAEPLYAYTEIYVTWDDVKYVSYEYGTGVEKISIYTGSCVVENGEDRSQQSESCEVALPELNVLTGYHTPLWYKKGEDITYPNLTITLTGDEILEAKAIANSYTVVYQPGEGTGEMESQEFEYDKEESLNKNKYRKEGYHFSGWIDMLGKEYRDGEKVLNLLTEGVLELTAQWLQNPPAAGGGQSIIPAPKEQEHNAAEEKLDDKQESNQDKQQEEQSKTPENTNTSNQTNTQQSSSTSPDNSYKTVVDPEIQSAYEWAYERDVTTIPSLDDAMPDGVVKRGHLAKMVVNYATNVLGREIPEKIPSECRWNDWRKDRESEEIKDYAVKSCALGLMGLDMPKFLPNMEVTRAQFGTIMSRLLWGKKYAGGTPYYRKHLNALKENNIMTQIENPERRVELRQWVWLMLMRSAENK